MPQKDHAFPRKFLCSAPPVWQLGSAATIDDVALLQRLDVVHARLSSSDGGAVHPPRALAVTMSELLAERHAQAALRLSQLPIAPLRDHPALAERRLAALAQLEEIEALVGEIRRLTALPSLTAEQHARLTLSATGFGLSWRLSDVLPAPVPLVHDLDLAPMDWLRQPLPGKAGTADSHARTRALAATGRRDCAA